nr:putative reverse transcriptase domain, PPM-type phosphatase domain, protein phosphatase 2C family [Tanacetum cinerariifolium]
MFQPLFDKYFNPPPRAVSPDPVAVVAPRAVDPVGSPSSTIIDQDVPSASTSPTSQEIQSQVTHQGVEEQIHGHQNAQFDNAPLLHNLSSGPSSKETSLQWVIPSNLHHLNQSFDTLTKFKKNHPLENVIGDLSRLVPTRSQLQEHVIYQNQRDLPRDNPLVSVEVLRYDIKRSKSENKGIVSTEMELVLEQTQQGTSREVSQGDPLGPLFFALVLHLLVHKIRHNCKLLLHAWYLDDGTVIGDSEEVSRVLDIIKVCGPGLGLELDIKKTKIFWPSCNGINLRDGLFPVNIRRASLGVKLFRGAVSRDTYFISRLAIRIAANAVALILLHKIRHNCKLLLHAWYLDDGTVIGDSEEVSRVLDIIKVCGPGLGLELNIRKTNIFWPSCNGIKLRDGLFPVDIRRASLESSFECLRVPHTHDFLLANPIDGIGQLMSPVEYRTIFKYRLKIPLFLVDAICPVCRKACLDSFGEHATHCKELSGFKYCHDMVTDVLFYICRRAGISAKKEALVNFLTDPSDGRSTLRPVNVLVFGWVGGKHACVELTGVSPLEGLSSRGFTVGRVALKAASCKVTKHEKSCIENQHVFIPFVFDTLGLLAHETVKLLTRV